MLLIYNESIRAVTYVTILEYDWHSKAQQKDSYGKRGPIARWKKGPSDKGHEKSQGTWCLFHLNLPWLVLSLGLPGPQDSCETGATPALKEDRKLLSPAGHTGVNGTRWDVTQGAEGDGPCYHHRNIMVIRAGSRWLEKCKCHTHLQ